MFREWEKTVRITVNDGNSIFPTPTPVPTATTRPLFPTPTFTQRPTPTIQPTPIATTAPMPTPDEKKSKKVKLALPFISFGIVILNSQWKETMSIIDSVRRGLMIVETMRRSIKAIA